MLNLKKFYDFVLRCSFKTLLAIFVGVFASPLSEATRLSPSEQKIFTLKKSRFDFLEKPHAEKIIADGLSTLLRNSYPENLRTPFKNWLDLDENSLEERIAEKKRAVLQFGEKYFSILEDARRSGPITYYSRVKKKFDMEIERISFKSLYQRPKKHASNWVHGYLYRPVRKKGCRLMLPTVLIVQHSTDDISPEKTLAKTLVRMGHKINVALLYLPHFGPRRAENEKEREKKLDLMNMSFLSADPEIFKENVFQTILDIQVFKELLRSRPEVDRSNMTTLGLSLGAIFSALHLSIHPDPEMKLSLQAGGGNFQSIFSNYINEYPKDKLSLAILAEKNLWKDEFFPYAEIDPIVWASRLRARKILMINSKKDEILNPKYSIKLLRQSLRDQNKVKQKWLPGIHNPENIGIFKQLTKILLPQYGFILQTPHRKRRKCVR